MEESESEEDMYMRMTQEMEKCSAAEKVQKIKKIAEEELKQKSHRLHYQLCEDIIKKTNETQHAVDNLRSDIEKAYSRGLIKIHDKEKLFMMIDALKMSLKEKAVLIEIQEIYM